MILRTEIDWTDK